MTLSAFLPRLVGYSFEDIAAKGLRAFDDSQTAPPRAEYLSVTEMIALKPALALQAERGAGKTWLADWLERIFAEDALGVLTAPLVRNPEGDIRDQTWPLGRLGVLRDPDATAIANAAPATLMLFDGLPADDAVLTQAVKWAKGNPQGRVLLLVTPDALAQSRLPAEFVTNRLLDLPKAACAAQSDLSFEDWNHAGRFAMSVAAGRVIDPADGAVATQNPPAWLEDDKRAIALAAGGIEDILSALPTTTAPVLRKLCARLVHDKARSRAVLQTILEGQSALWRLLEAETLTRTHPDLAPELATHICAAITGAPATLRQRAGHALSRLGDPRQLDMLVSVPAGDYPMGGSSISGTSEPAYRATLPAFAISAYPVTVAAYGAYCTAAGHAWLSPAKDDPSRQNQPATDLSWHDARAYCAWLTEEWRVTGRISPDQTLRLPLEREWEAAARGGEGRAYPWGPVWKAEHCNGEETGLNDVCAVGLFPEGISPFGTHDMAGNIWEWCLTLWGPDMTSPDFKNPWRDDGREDLDAAPHIRRILRGGSFVSPAEKTNGVYRGSLEPHGSWRGNGFRMVLV